MTQSQKKLYIGGEWVNADGIGSIPVLDSLTEEPIGVVSIGTADDVDAAVHSAAEASIGWAEVAPDQRAAYLDALGDALDRRRDELARLVTREVGTIRPTAYAWHQGYVEQLHIHARMARTYEWRDKLDFTVVAREPVGVVGAVTPWNAPLFMIIGKLAPALAAGCTLVLKAAEVAPLTSFVLAEAIDEIGLPAGVFNLVTGDAATGDALVRHPLVDMISFTGSTNVGRRIAAVAAETTKRVSLELGGKSACIVLDDGDLAAAVSTTMKSITANNGQGCSALSRLVVPRRMLKEAEERAVEFVERLVVGDPWNESTTIGPLASAGHRDRVEQYLTEGVKAARLVVGGPGGRRNFDRGYFVNPSVYVADPSARISQEEIFGPVETIIAHDGDDDAVAIANDVIYGLAGAVFSDDPDHANRIAIRCGSEKSISMAFAITLSHPLAATNSQATDGRGA